MAGFSERATLRSNFLSQDWRKAGASPESASAGRGLLTGSVPSAGKGRHASARSQAGPGVDMGQPGSLPSLCLVKRGFAGGLDSKESACNAGGLGLIPGSGRPPGEGNGSPLRYSCLENPMGRGAWRATVPESQSQTQLSNYVHSVR